MVHLAQFSVAVAVAQHAKVELVVFCCFADKCTFLDRRDKERNGIPIIHLMDEIALGPAGKEDCLFTGGQRREGCTKVRLTRLL